MIFVLFFVFILNSLFQSAGTEYKLSMYSEDYNTYYLYCDDIGKFVKKDTICYVDAKLPNSFVVELGALEGGEKTVFVYDDNKELLISNKKGRLIVGGHKVAGKRVHYSKISLYFVNGKVVVYLDDFKRKEWSFDIDTQKRIGIKLSRKDGYICKHFNCYEPRSFRLADYGRLLDKGTLSETKQLRAVPHNVGESYSLTFPTSIANHSERAIKFDYRYEDSKKVGVNSMKRARSEISGVFSQSPKNKWIIEFDFLVPHETIDDYVVDIITQIHEDSSTPVSPAFYLFMREGFLSYTAKGDSLEISTWKKLGKPRYMDSKQMVYLSKDQWHHIKIYLKEGWQREDLPLTRVWVDGRLLCDSEVPNCYHYKTQKNGYYNYIKFGVYKSGWMKTEKSDIQFGKRVYYFDNYIVKY